jgi:hypothetical protein
MRPNVLPGTLTFTVLNALALPFIRLAYKSQIFI